ncbi:hypothetical protein [Meridianimarinicoccus aquatilis]|uniref:Lipoprotein n=1 Tax=Meridianimarinicoccus aquatilis TaxID=2552766 RepID=A0A4R6ALJ0_9RHOB|nr:hypothetical protein [Fluviibacterium aquatile]QIE43460.1 hypothetical protein G5B39_15655 [Rhodobacteraceae bacterium SC52]TDL85181.1 hypothetical protein E2L05_16115 [Fluviibacterium aquatile]
MKNLSLVALLVVVGCTSQQAINAQYAGESLTTVISDLGPPDEANALSDGKTEYIWRDAATEDGINSCYKRILTDGGGKIEKASYTDGRGPC